MQLSPFVFGTPDKLTLIIDRISQSKPNQLPGMVQRGSARRIDGADSDGLNGSIVCVG
jgi:hypothetical protein